MVTTVISVIAIVGSFIGVAAIVYIAATGHGERAAEEAAREHFARHGRWPDDPPDLPATPPTAPAARDRSSGSGPS